MKLVKRLLAFVILLGLCSTANAAGQKDGDLVDKPQLGKDYALFENQIKPKHGRTIIHITWYLKQMLLEDFQSKCEYGKQNCCYGKDHNGCCIGGSGNCSPCPGPRCPIPCFNGQGPGCPPPICPGPNCPYPCPGPQCPIVCPGPYCGQLCPGPRCPIRCPGPNCPTPCPGPLCPVPCYGPQCGGIICPPQICNIGFSGRLIIFNINTKENIISNGSTLDTLQNIISNGSILDTLCVTIHRSPKSVKVCGPVDNISAYITPNNQYQVKIKRPDDPRLTITTNA